ncbi:hypothetical protein SAMN05216516_102496 [Izhakiella capsodis]|uniref:Uncharacterized protein n=1 Tax=Izhakiella capsodis TaxID=1367852 RepID=A0A1I4WIN1_9GAMM|nr:hypothetical protein SAMN05216516_102496 [Izhakiella capsodis]
MRFRTVTFSAYFIQVPDLLSCVYPYQGSPIVLVAGLCADGFIFISAKFKYYFCVLIFRALSTFMTLFSFYSYQPGQNDNRSSKWTIN